MSLYFFNPPDSPLPRWRFQMGLPTTMLPLEEADSFNNIRQERPYIIWFILVHKGAASLYVYKNWINVKISTGSVLLCTGPNHFPVREQLGSSAQEHWSVKIITHVQILDTCQDLNRSSAPVHWTQSFPSSGAAWV